MTRAMLKGDENVYRVVIDRAGKPASKHHPARPPYKVYFGPYGTAGAAKGQLTHETKGYFGDGTGKVQVIENPQWKDLP